MVRFVTQNEASHLLHNKFVVILGGSVQRCMYKDLVLLLQQDIFLTPPQLMTKGEASFERDCLVEGGGQEPMSNGGAGYREVRQYCSKHHLVRFYFLTRIYSPYMESILEDLRGGDLKPDLVFVNSSVGDVSRCSRLPGYHENLRRFFEGLKTATSDDCLRVWLLTLPLGDESKGGPPVPEIGHQWKCRTRSQAPEADLRCAQLALAHGLDVLDLHFHFRLSLRHRMADGVHWDAYAHRWVTALLLFHAAAAWGVKMIPPPPPPADPGPTGGPGQGGTGPVEILANAARRRPERSGPARRRQSSGSPDAAPVDGPQAPPFAWRSANASVSRNHVTEAARRRPCQPPGARTGRAVVAPPPCWPPHAVMRRRHMFPPWRARVHPYRPAFWHPGPRHPGPGHPGPGPSRPWHPGPLHSRPWHPGPLHPRPWHPGPRNSVPWHPGPGHCRPWHPGPRNSGPGNCRPGLRGPSNPGPGHSRPWHPGPGHPGPGHSRPWHPGPRNSGPGHPGPWAPGGRW